MGIMSRFQGKPGSGDTTPRNSVENVHTLNPVAKFKRGSRQGGDGTDAPIKIFRLRILAMVLIVSLGGLIFGQSTIMSGMRAPLTARRL